MKRHVDLICSLLLVGLLAEWLLVNEGTRLWVAHALSMWGVLLRG